MRNVIARCASAVVLATATGLSSYAEDYQCQNDSGCSASITEDGELQEVVFRKGDLVSTDAGWVVSPDDGWVKVRMKRTGH